MPAISKLSDETIRQYLDKQFTQQEIANLCGVSQQAVNKRVKALEHRSQALKPAYINAAVISMWDTRRAAEENYKRSLALYDEALSDPDCSIGEKARVLGEIRGHIDFGLKALQLLYEVNEMKAFQDEVTAVLEEFAPGVRAKIIKRLSEKRSIRAAVQPV